MPVGGPGSALKVAASVAKVAKTAKVLKVAEKVITPAVKMASGGGRAVTKIAQKGVKAAGTTLKKSKIVDKAKDAGKKLTDNKLVRDTVGRVTDAGKRFSQTKVGRAGSAAVEKGKQLSNWAKESDLAKGAVGRVKGAGRGIGQRSLAVGRGMLKPPNWVNANSWRSWWRHECFG